MKLLKKALASAMIIGAMFMANGCSTMEVVTGGDLSSLDHELADVEPSLVEIKKPRFSHHKSYVIFNEAGVGDFKYQHPSALWEVVDGKVVFVSVIKEMPGRAVVEVTPGEHKFIKNSVCGLYMVTIDAKQGYVYQIDKGNMGSPSLMSWCRNQAYFSKDDTITYRHQTIYQNFTLVEGTEELAAEVVEDSGIQDMYDDFIADIDEINPDRNLYISAEEGERI